MLLWKEIKLFFRVVDAPAARKKTGCFAYLIQIAANVIVIAT